MMNTAGSRRQRPRPEVVAAIRAGWPPAPGRGRHPGQRVVLTSLLLGAASRCRRPGGLARPGQRSRIERSGGRWRRSRVVALVAAASATRSPPYRTPERISSSGHGRSSTSRTGGDGLARSRDLPVASARRVRVPGVHAPNEARRSWSPSLASRERRRGRIELRSRALARGSADPSPTGPDLSVPDLGTGARTAPSVHGGPGTGRAAHAPRNPTARRHPTGRATVV